MSHQFYLLYVIIFNMDNNQKCFSIIKSSY